MPVPDPTENEIVSVLKKSTLPTILVEGKEDMSIYRWLEKQIKTSNANVMSCGGRNTLFSVYKRKDEFSHLPVAFVADKDFWVFGSVPNEYEQVILTSGYSIENDLYAGSNIENLIEDQYKSYYMEILISITKWFSFEIQQFLNGNEAVVSFNIEQVLDKNRSSLNNDFLAFRRFCEPEQRIFNNIKTNYNLLLRGKTLFQCLLRVLRKSGAQYNEKTLFQICLLTTNHLYLNQLTEKVMLQLERNKIKKT